jgi:endonuclease YncB( thermonuclease family)
MTRVKESVPLCLGVAALFAASLVIAAGTQELTGTATPVQGDQIALGRTRILIYGIDAPDPDQDLECKLDGEPFDCFSAAKRKLAELLDLGPVACVGSGQSNYVGLPYMTCTVAGQDIGEQMVRSGNALAFLPQSNRYVPAEEAARREKLGVWQNGIRFTRPWVWRQQHDRAVLGP